MPKNKDTDYLPSGFRDEFIKHAGHVEEDELKQIMRDAHLLLSGEESEKNLFFYESHYATDLISAINDALDAFDDNWDKNQQALGYDPQHKSHERMFLQQAKAIAVFLRKKSISKIAMLKTLTKDAHNISQDAETALDYDHQILRLNNKLNKKTAKRKPAYKKAYLQKMLARANNTRLAMEDIDRNADQIRDIEKKFLSATRSMLDILEGGTIKHRILGNMRLDKLIGMFKRILPIGPMIGPSSRAENAMKNLARVLRREMEMARSFFGIVSSIEQNDHNIIRLQARISNRAA